ncbi:MAG: GIY-YIG nuclease family protein [Candidatus Gastranaerophilales bacterium]|nr:GIY-YIG nuclease family protein [Candidatus Gastranaerophilales bacterium]
MPKSYFVYILLTQNNTYYCGYTDDVEARFKKHLEGKASKYTRAFKPVKVVYSQEFATKSEAMKEELRIKALTREQKDLLIKVKR